MSNVLVYPEELLPYNDTVHCNCYSDACAIIENLFELLIQELDLFTEIELASNRSDITVNITYSDGRSIVKQFRFSDS